MTTEKFIPALSANDLSAQCAALLRASSDLMHTLTADLGLEKQDGLNRLLVGGGRVGLKVTINQHGENEISLIGVEREGRHLTLATVHSIGGSGARGLAQ